MCDHLSKSCGTEMNFSTDPRDACIHGGGLLTDHDGVGDGSLHALEVSNLPNLIFPIKRRTMTAYPTRPREETKLALYVGRCSGR